MNQPSNIEYLRAKAGYFIQEPRCACRCCGACVRDGKYFWCNRHEMWVNSRAICFSFSKEPFLIEEEQMDFGELFNSAT